MLLTTQLPLKWEVDRYINQIPRSTSINLHPYYSHFQKDEIEKLVQQMMVEMIQPSQSLYISLILLFKKKDERWRFCVDYWALKKVNIPNHYLYQ